MLILCWHSRKAESERRRLTAVAGVSMNDGAGASSEEWVRQVGEQVGRWRRRWARPHFGKAPSDICCTHSHLLTRSSAAVRGVRPGHWARGSGLGGGGTVSSRRSRPRSPTERPRGRHEAQGLGSTVTEHPGTWVPWPWRGRPHLLSESTRIKWWCRWTCKPW